MGVTIFRNVLGRAGFAVLVLTVVGLSACGSDTSSLGSGGLMEQTALQPHEVGKTISKMVAYRPAIGPPENVGGELTRQLNDAAVEQGIALLIDPAVKPELSLRGYVTALRKGQSINITYLWDVIDGKGNRVTRIAGEETLTAGADAKQPWSAVTPVVTRMIAQKTMVELGQWMKSNPAGAAQGTAPQAISSSPATVVSPPAGTGAYTGAR